jgi:hypothetical protein
MNISSSQRIASMPIFHTDFWCEFLHKQLCLNFFLSKKEEPTVDYEALYLELQKYPEIGRSESEEWDSADMADAHWVLFNGSMSLLTLVGETEEKRDILAWIFAPNYQERISKGKLVTKHVSDIPFSFYRCAKEIGVQDVDEFREKLLTYFEPEVVKRLKEYLQSIH